MIRELPAQKERVETGAIRFGDDWPGLFIRGDRAIFFGMCLREILALVPNSIYKVEVESIMQLIDREVDQDSGWPPGIPAEFRALSAEEFYNRIIRGMAEEHFELHGANRNEAWQREVYPVFVSGCQMLKHAPLEWAEFKQRMDAMILDQVQGGPLRGSGK